MNLFLAATPLHFFNTCELICGSFPEEKNGIIIMSDLIQEYLPILTLLTEEGYDITSYDYHHLNSNGCNLIPKTFLKKIILEKILKFQPKLDGLEYESVDRIVVYAPNAFSVYLRVLFPEASVVFGEDGLGTYTGSTYERIFYLDNANNRESNIKKKVLGKIDQLFFSKGLSHSPKKVLLHFPLLNCCEQPCPIKKINRNKHWKKLFYKYLETNKFFYGNDDYRQYDGVFLGRPADSPNEVEITNSLLSTAEKCNLKIAYRKHPREKNVFRSNDLGMWELRCAEEITSSSIIISAFSTASIIPKIYYDLEPFLLFFYPILEKELGKEFKNANMLIRKIRMIYSDQTKVIVATSIDELMSYLVKLNK